MTGTAVGSIKVNMFLDTVEMTSLERSESMALDITTVEDHGNTKDGNQSCDETMTLVTDDEDDDSKSSGSSSLGDATRTSSASSAYLSGTAVSNSVCGTEVSTAIAPKEKTEPSLRPVTTGGHRTMGFEFQKAKNSLNSTNQSAAAVGASFVFTSKANEALRRVRDNRRNLLRTVEVQNSRIRELEAELAILKSEHSLTRLENLLLGGDLRNVLQGKEQRMASTGGKKTDAEKSDNDSCMAQASHGVVNGTLVQEDLNTQQAYHF
jgi:hypothetical protein